MLIRASADQLARWCCYGVGCMHLLSLTLVVDFDLVLRGRRRRVAACLSFQRQPLLAHTRHTCVIEHSDETQTQPIEQSGETQTQPNCQESWQSKPIKCMHVAIATRRSAPGARLLACACWNLGSFLRADATFAGRHKEQKYAKAREPAGCKPTVGEVFDEACLERTRLALLRAGAEEAPVLVETLLQRRLLQARRLRSTRHRRCTRSQLCHQRFRGTTPRARRSRGAVDLAGKRDQRTFQFSISDTGLTSRLLFPSPSPPPMMLNAVWKQVLTVGPVST